MTNFETVVTHLQCLINIFGMSINLQAGKLPDDLINIRQNWDTLVLSEVKVRLLHCKLDLNVFPPGII